MWLRSRREEGKWCKNIFRHHIFPFHHHSSWWRHRTHQSFCVRVDRNDRFLSKTYQAKGNSKSLLFSSSASYFSSSSSASLLHIRKKKKSRIPRSVAVLVDARPSLSMFFARKLITLVAEMTFTISPPSVQKNRNSINSRFYKHNFCPGRKLDQKEVPLRVTGTRWIPRVIVSTSK